MIPEKAHGSRKSSRFQKKLTVPEKAHGSRKSSRFQKKHIPPQRGVPLPRGTILLGT
jgi:hypothetical protein